ncbi:hypothetical protein QL285_010763 [Trifolium repens]|nr:hypothetical protein QL285_010763 [Trifolium repens]
MLALQTVGFRDVFVALWHTLDQSQLVNFAMTAWSIWQRRNLQIWDNKSETPKQIIARGQGVLQAWQRERVAPNRSCIMGRQQQHEQMTRWQPFIATT